VFSFLVSFSLKVETNMMPLYQVTATKQSSRPAVTNLECKWNKWFLGTAYRLLSTAYRFDSFTNSGVQK